MSEGGVSVFYQFVLAGLLNDWKTFFFLLKEEASGLKSRRMLRLSGSVLVRL